MGGTAAVVVARDRPLGPQGAFRQGPANARVKRAPLWPAAWRDPGGAHRAETHASRRTAEAPRPRAERPELAGSDRSRDADRESPLEAESWWTDHVEPNLAQSTVLSYANVLDRHLRPCLGETPIRDLDPGTTPHRAGMPASNGALGR